jgi:hypothetical protein
MPRRKVRNETTSRTFFDEARGDSKGKRAYTHRKCVLHMDCSCGICFLQFRAEHMQRSLSRRLYE